MYCVSSPFGLDRVYVATWEGLENSWMQSVGRHIWQACMSWFCFEQVFIIKHWCTTSHPALAIGDMPQINIR